MRSADLPQTSLAGKVALVTGASIMGAPEEVARVVAWLCSDEAA